MKYTLIFLVIMSACATAPQIIREPYEVVKVLQIPLPAEPAYFFTTMTPDEAELWCLENTDKCLQELVKDHGLSLSNCAKLRAIIKANITSGDGTE